MNIEGYKKVISDKKAKIEELKDELEDMRSYASEMEDVINDANIDYRTKGV